MLGIHDDLALDFLENVLWNRSITSPEGWVSTELLVQEHERMRQELGVDKFLSETLSFDQSIQAVLTGTLHVDAPATP